MEERLTSQQKPNQYHPSTISRRPISNHREQIRHSSPPASSQTFVEPPIPIHYIPYRSPVEEPPGAFQYAPYRSPTENAAAPFQYVPYRSPTDAFPVSLQSTPYRIPSVARTFVSRDMSKYSVKRISRAPTSIDVISPISPVSPVSTSSFNRRPSARSMHDTADSISREVSLYQADVTAPRIPPSPLMELSAQEAAHRNSIQVSSTTGSVLRSRAAMIHAVSSNQPTRDRPGGQSLNSGEAICDWLPVGLRWPYILFVFFLSIGLAGLIWGLMIASEKNQGLGRVHSSSIFVFGWRYIPTILAVLYVSFAAVIVQDIRRTRPYARLSLPDGASASSSLFLTQSPFWLNLRSSLRREGNGGYRDWALFWAITISLLGQLIVVPFSSAFLFQLYSSSSKAASFSHWEIPSDTPLQMSTDDSIIVKTTSGIPLNTTTSIWASNNYTVLPFWPTDLENNPTGAVLSSTAEQWTARTTIFRTSLECELMNLTGFVNTTVSKQVGTTSNGFLYELMNMTSFTLKSNDGCSLDFVDYSGSGRSDKFFEYGGGWWSRSPNFTYPSIWNPRNGTLGDLDTLYPILFNSSDECGDRNVILYAAPQKEGESFQAQGHICRLAYFSANLPVTITNTGYESTIRFDESQFNNSMKAIRPSPWNISALEISFFSSDWSSAANSTLNLSLKTKPMLGGPLNILEAENEYDIMRMMNNPNLIDTARQTQQRFFGESLLASLSESRSQHTGLIKGQIITREGKIVASLPVGIVLVTTLLFSSLMIGLVAGYTRPHERPLNLARDPTTTQGIASLIHSGQNTRALFEGLDTSTEASMQRRLSRQVFYLRHGVVYSYDIRDAYQHSPGSTDAHIEVKDKEWRPRIIRGWALILLVTTLAAILLALVVLYSTSRDSGISQNPLTSNYADNNDNSSLTATAPYSIIPCLFAVGIRIWWGPIDQNFRTLQPYISMAKVETPNSQGTSLSYVILPSLWAFGKAVSNRHFFLALVISGTLFSETLIISMSALWSRNLSKHTEIIGRSVIKLEFNRSAVILSLTSLAFLIATSLFIAAYNKHHTRPLPRNVDTLGSILGFIYSSDRLLHSTSRKQIPSRDDQDRKVKMGWFNSNGRRRWGIEIVAEREEQVAQMLRGEERPGWSEVPGTEGVDLGGGGAYETMATRTPPMAVASPTMGTLHAVRYG